MVEIHNMMGGGRKAGQYAVSTYGSDPIAQAAPAWMRWKTNFQEWMDDRRLGEYSIDEVAMMFASLDDKDEWVGDAVSGSAVHFNRAVDFVTTSPIYSSYAVQYDFLQPDEALGLDMRVEAMAMLDGRSPLHQSILRPDLNPHVTHEDFSPVVVHFSFKTPTEKEYREVMERLDNLDSCEFVQRCKSSYGAFSYWRIPEMGLNTYLKPRVNLRDQGGENPNSDHPNTVQMYTSDRGGFGMPGVGSRNPHMHHEHVSIGEHNPTENDAEADARVRNRRAIRDEPQA